jgi:rhamnogalacturonan acetylesterase
MAPGGGGSGTQGWWKYLRLVLQDRADGVELCYRGPRREKLYERGGQGEEGDWVVVKFGHNDGGNLSMNNGRTDCFGMGARVVRLFIV